MEPKKSDPKAETKSDPKAAEPAVRKRPIELLLDRVRGHELPADNGIAYLDADSLKTLPWCQVTVTQEKAFSRNSGIVTERYWALIQFSYLLKRRVQLTSDQYGLIALSTGKAFIDKQFTIQAHARVVRTDWPAKDGGSARFTFAIEAQLSPEVNIVERLDDSDPFVSLYLKSLNLPQFRKDNLPYVRVPRSDEKDDPKSDSEVPF